MYYNSISMTFYRKLGSISFYSQTQAYEIFKNSQNTLIMQLKPEISFNQQIYNNFIDHHDLHQINFQLYSENKKPLSILVHHAKLYDLEQIKLQQFTALLAQIINIMNHWDSDKVGEINPDLFFTIDGNIIFFSLQYWKRQQPLHKILLSFIEKLSLNKITTYKILMKRLKKCKSIEQILEQTKYFGKIYSLKMVQTTKQKLSIYNNSLNMAPLRRKYDLFKKKDLNQLYLKGSQTSSVFKKQSQFINYRGSSRAIHISHQNISMTKSIRNSISKEKISVSLRSNSKKKNEEKSYSLILKNKDKYCRNSSKSNFKNKHNSIKKTGASSFYNQPVNCKKIQMRQMLNKSLQNWQIKKNQSKIIHHKRQSKQQKKKLKKTGCLDLENRKNINNITTQSKIIKSIQKQQSCYTSQNYQNNSQKQEISFKNLISENKKPEQIKEKVSVSIPTIQFDNHQIKDNHKVVDKQVVSKISLRQQMHFDNCDTKKNTPVASSTKRKTRNKNQTIHQQGIQKSNKENQSFNNYNLIGQTVANTNKYLKRFNDIFWQLPMFFMYKRFFIRRLLFQQNGNPDIKQENELIQKSLKKLLAITMKKINKSQGNNENIMKFLNMDLTQDFKQIQLYIFQQYVNSLYKSKQVYPELYNHILEVIDSLLIFQGKFIDQTKKSKALNDNKIKQYIDERFNQLKKTLQW